MPQETVEIDKKMLERGYWLATHRLALKKWTTISLYAVIAIVYAIFFINFGIYMYRYGEWQTLVGQATLPLVDWSVAERSAPISLEFGSPQLFPLGDNRYDMIVEVSNPNSLWGVESFTYQFMLSDGSSSPIRSTYVLPNERKFLTVLGFKAPGPLSGIANFSADGFRWKKVSRQPPLSFIFTELPTYEGRQVIIRDGVQTVLPARVTWAVKNGSTLNLRTVVWQIALYNGGRLAGVVELTGEKFPFLVERTFEVTIPSIATLVDKVTVTPLVNIFDPDFYYVG